MQLTRFRAIGLAAGVAAFFALLLADTPLQDYGEFGSRPARAAAVAALMAIWWLTEALPIYATACAPLVLFPALAVFGPGVAENLRGAVLPYLDPYIFLFAGGMCIAAAMQQWDLHRRIALTIMSGIGTDPRRLLAGFLAATAFISMWISNTATATMMVPIGIAVIAQLERQRDGVRLRHYGMAVMLSIAYAANVGGIGTKIGTAPNAIFAGALERAGTPVSFLEFMILGLPFVVAFLPVVWLALWRLGRKDGLGGELGEEAVAGELARLGAMKAGERIVLGVFLVTAALWIAGRPLTDLARAAFPEAGISSAHVEGGIAIAAALVLFATTSRGTRVLRPRSLRTVPWETLLLLGGSFALAEGIQGSGLSEWLGIQLLVLRGLAPFGQVLAASLGAVALSALASNTATIALLVVVLRDAVSPEILPAVLLAATVACSCDFALPVGTPPNAIVFGSGYVTIPRMARTGAVLDLAAALLAAAWCWLAAGWVL